MESSFLDYLESLFLDYRESRFPWVGWVSMKVITVAAPKGGSGKSTLVTALAARASLESARVAMFDLNSDQANLTQWHILRGEPPNPALVPVEKISRDTEVLRNEKFDWLIIDTPPLDLDVIEAAVAVADAVIIPVRASIFDIGAITCVVEMCRERRKPYAFVLSAVDGKMPKPPRTAAHRR